MGTRRETQTTPLEPDRIQHFSLEPNHFYGRDHACDMAAPPYPMFAPCSAKRRCLNARRYLVRSYVTRPTTMSAITVIPAKTPKPIGKTCSDRPGIWKAAADDVDGAVSSAAVADERADTALPNAPVGDGVSVPLTDVKPSATTAAPEPEPAEDVDPVVETASAASVADGAAERMPSVATTP